MDHKGRIHRNRTHETKRRDVSLVPFFLLGLVLPIDTMGGVPPVLFDVLRYGLALVIVVASLSRPRESRPNPLLGWVTFLLTTAGALAIAKAVFLGGSLFTGVVAFISPLVAFLVVRGMAHQCWLMLGFVAGCTLSAIDIIFQANGLPYLGVPSEYGFRYSGFSFGSTKVAPFLAVALCVVITPWAWAKRRVLLRVALAVALGAALFLSQGRGGVAGLLAALAILVFTLLRRRPLLGFGLLLVVPPVLYFSGAFSALSDHVLRSNVQTASDLTTGRSALNSASWDAFWAGGPLGVDPSIRHLLRPHIAPLTSGVDVGPFGLMATSVVCVLLAYTMFLAPARVPVVFRMIAAVALVAALLEPTGFFVGFSGAMIVALCFAQFAQTVDNARHEVDGQPISASPVLPGRVATMQRCPPIRPSLPVRYTHGRHAMEAP